MSPLWRFRLHSPANLLTIVMMWKIRLHSPNFFFCTSWNFWEFRPQSPTQKIPDKQTTSINMHWRTHWWYVLPFSFNWLRSGVKTSWCTPLEKLILLLGLSDLSFRHTILFLKWKISMSEGNPQAHFCPQKLCLLRRSKALSEKKNWRALVQRWSCSKIEKRHRKN